MTTTIPISAELIQLFNQAAELARGGDLEGALRTLERLLNPTEEDKQGPARVSSGDFLGQAYMRKAWLLMDLGRHAEARTVFEDPFLKACLGQFSLNVLYDYFFSYANTLGNLGDVSGMDDAFTRAMNIAADELGDAERMHVCWSNLLTWAEGARAWEYLDVETQTCLQFAENVGDKALGMIAGLSRAMTLSRLGRKDEARSIVQPLRDNAERNDWHHLMDRIDDILRAIGN